MTPSDYAAEELALWERALQDQREAEARLEALRASHEADDFYECVQEVELLRTRADLLLARAVKIKCDFRERKRAS